MKKINVSILLTSVCFILASHWGFANEFKAKTVSVNSGLSTTQNVLSNLAQEVLNANYNITFVGDQKRGGSLCSLGFGDRAEIEPQVHFRLQGESRKYVSWSLFQMGEENEWRYHQFDGALEYIMTLYSDYSPKSLKRIENGNVTADCVF